MKVLCLAPPDNAQRLFVPSSAVFQRGARKVCNARPAEAALPPGQRVAGFCAGLLDAWEARLPGQSSPPLLSRPGAPFADRGRVNR